MQTRANQSTIIPKMQMDYQYIKMSPQQQDLLQQLAQSEPQKEKVLNTLRQIYQSQSNKYVITLQNLLTALKELPQNISTTFLERTLPKMAQAALNILNTKPKIPLMVKTSHIQLPQQLIFQFLSMQFFHFRQNQAIGNNYQFPNGSYLSIIEDTFKLSATEKIKCHIHYFNEASENKSNDSVSFHRISIDQQFHSKFFQQNIDYQDVWQYWEYSKAPLKEIIFTVQPIESFHKSIIVDFANKFLGGGVLGRGCVQEEILLTLMPEAMAAIFFTSKLEDKDAFFIGNATTYSNYSGYGEGFKFKPQDPINKKQMILAMDAECYLSYYQQFNQQNIIREIDKSFISFSQGQEVNQDFCKNLNDQEQNIITGKWGCGAFGGNVELKLLIQLIAFSQAKTYFKENFNLIFSTFQDEKEANNFKRQLEMIRQKFETVGKLSTALRNLKQQGFMEQKKELIDYLLKK